MSCTRSPDWKVRSIVPPVRRSRTRVRIVALPRPGLLCEYSRTLYRCPSNSKVTHLRKSLTSIIQVAKVLSARSPAIIPPGRGGRLAGSADRVAHVLAADEMQV